MQVTDPIADMLTRIRNAGRAGKLTCEMPASNMKRAIADILVDEDTSRRSDIVMTASRAS